MEKVSIIIPVYNTKEEYLQKCIESIKEQTYKNIEIIIVDDGSKEAVSQVCDDIAKTDNRINIFHKINEGVSIARNFGVEKATGEWLCFVDSDDWIEKDAIEALLNQTFDNSVVLSRTFIDDEKIKIERETKDIEKEEVIDAMFFQNELQCYFLESSCGKLYNKEFLIKENILFSANLPRGEDMLFNLEAYKKAKKIGFIEEYTYHYRTNHVSVTKRYDNNFVEKNNLLYKKLREKLDSLNEKNLEDQYNFFVIRHLNNACWKYIYSKENNMTNKERKVYIKALISTEPYKAVIKKIKFKNLGRRKSVLIILLRLKLFELIPYLYK